MALDPGIRTLLDQLDESGVDLTTLPPAEARELFAGVALLDGEPDPVAAVEDRTVPGPDGPIPVRTYRPEGDGPFPVLVFFHGGGWVIGDIDTHDNVCRRLANGAGCAVVSVGYRLAPEHPAPAAGEDCWAALRWVAEHADDLDVDPTRIAVGGDSAGGNLSAVVAQRAAAEGGPRLSLQLLIYPGVDLRMGHASIAENGEGYFLTEDTMRWFCAQYLSGGADVEDPTISPLLAADDALRDVAPAYVITAGYDPLRDEGQAYAKRLEAAGTAVTHVCYDDMIHGFIQMSTATPRTVEATGAAAAALRDAFA